jgi:hypothetical protein
MRIVDVGRWKLDCDVVATALCYSALPNYHCSCGDCRNFMAALDAAFPRDFRLMASQLGVDPSKPAEVWHYNRETSGLHYYGGMFHLVGRIVSGMDAIKPTCEVDFEKLPSGFEFGFSNKLALIEEPFRERQVVELNFATLAPWVISDPESD